MEIVTSVMVAVTGDVSLLDNAVLNTCHTIIKRFSAYFWIPIRRQHQRELAFLWLLPGYNSSGFGAQFNPQGSSAPQQPSTSIGLLLDWPKSSFGFSPHQLMKNPNELFGQPNTLITPLGFRFTFTAYRVSGTIPEFTECLRHFLGTHP